jgi:predicted DNA-binding protein
MKASMTGTLTIRLPGPAIRKIQAQASALGVTPSKLVRDVIERALETPGHEATAFELTSKWVGRVRSATAPHGRDAREALQDWNPDRRG